MGVARPKVTVDDILQLRNGETAARTFLTLFFLTSMLVSAMLRTTAKVMSNWFDVPQDMWRNVNTKTILFTFFILFIFLF